MLTDEQLARYNRQILMPGFDIAGQEALLAARVLVVGLGGLGCPAALYLATAGVGQLVLADGDLVELSNLQRQIAHGEADVGDNKAASAARAIAALNSDVTVRVQPCHLDAIRMKTLCADVDLVVDASDNYATRFDLNRACIAAGIPLVSAAAVRAEGQLAVFDPHSGGPCYRCLYPTEGAANDLSCSESGVLAPVVGVLGTLQAVETIKRLSGYPEALHSTLLVVDLATQETRRLTLSPRPECPDCSHLSRQVD